MVVRRQHLRHQCRPEVKRRRVAAFLRFATRPRAWPRVPPGDIASGAGQSRREVVVELVASPGPNRCTKSTRQLVRRGASRDEYEGIAPARRAGEFNEVCTVPGKVCSAKEPRASSGDHFRLGGSITAC
jgi:hypothetical protein